MATEYERKLEPFVEQARFLFSGSERLSVNYMVIER